MMVVMMVSRMMKLTITRCVVVMSTLTVIYCEIVNATAMLASCQKLKKQYLLIAHFTVDTFCTGHKIPFPIWCSNFRMASFQKSVMYCTMNIKYPYSGFSYRGRFSPVSYVITHLRITNENVEH